MSETQRSLFGPKAVARRNDPATSWEAAKSITELKLRASQHLILELLRTHGPMTDELIREHVQPWKMSDSGCRTRRKELVDLGLVEDSGARKLTRSGRKTIVWRAVQ